MDTKKDVQSADHRSFLAGELVMSCDPMVWILERSAYKTHCAYCLQKSPGLRTCSGCQLHRYCNSACQTADWKVEHKLECAVLKQIGNIDPMVALEGAFAGLLTDSCPLTMAVDTVCLDLDMTTKLFHKIKKNAMMEIPGIGRKSVRELLFMLPANPLQPELDPAILGKDSVAGNRQISGAPFMDFQTYCKIVRYNGVPIYSVFAPHTPIGRAVYPQAPMGRMTPVCFDMNVVLSHRGRRLFIHAAEDIPHFTGLGDLRYCGIGEPFCLTRAERRAVFEKRHQRPCTCRKCTEAYDADINPLQCVTVGCPNRIPSDNRALAACAECGALNSDRLAQLLRFMQQHESLKHEPLKDRYPSELHEAIILQMYKEMETAGILQPDAHFRYICGWDVAQKCYQESRFEDGWPMVEEFVTCARKVCPKYAGFRATLLLSAGMSTAAAMEKQILNGSCKLSEPAKLKLATLSGKACCYVLDYANEAMRILGVLFGKESKEAQISEGALKMITSTVCRIEQFYRESKE
ncbi:uncharacterized protein LOC129592864 [Paramacrobiotus metropolitanus]|uniref:uncharacterized protein LOC129592864 n=1 Tax=Paramacrobiotus metropolitanus TaxID=2943436 RepID=UPI0024456148|nr:uncharacterized protein LOC129592864 [Paramacrobiotus metropolitanus]